MDDRLIDAKEAQSFLVSPAWKRAYVKARQNLMDGWGNEQDAQKREVLWHTLQALAHVEAALLGEASDAYIDDMKTQAKG